MNIINNINIFYIIFINYVIAFKNTENIYIYLTTSKNKLSNLKNNKF